MSIFLICVLNVIQVFCITDNSSISRSDQDQVPIIPTPTTSIPVYPKSKKFLAALCRNKRARFDRFEMPLGAEAGVGEFKFQVMLGYRNHYNNDIEYICGGSLIADDIVITAATCVNDKNFLPLTVKLGRTSLIPDEYDESVGKDIEIQSVKVHSKFSMRHRHNNIALIKLKQPTKFSWSIETICLSTSDSNLPINFTISGYGRNNFEIEKTSNWIQKAAVNLYSFQNCSDLLKIVNKKLVETQFCSKAYKGTKVCPSDLGGPISYVRDGYDYLYGIVSYETEFDGIYTGINTKFNKFLEWIDDEMYEFEQK